MIGIHDFHFEQFRGEPVEQGAARGENFECECVGFVDNALNFQIDFSHGLFGVNDIARRLGAEIRARNRYNACDPGGRSCRTR